jgi:hypothetical protein
LNVPAVLKVRDSVVLDTSGMFAGAPVVESKTTLCGTGSNVQVTVPPRTMFTWIGENRRSFPALTTAVAGRITGWTGSLRSSLPVESEHPAATSGIRTRQVAKTDRLRWAGSGDRLERGQYDVETSGFLGEEKGTNRLARLLVCVSSVCCLTMEHLQGDKG